MAGNQHISESPVMMEIEVKKKDELVDWDILKYEWVTTGISLGGLAQKYNIPFYSVKNAHVRGKWGEALKEFNAMVDDAYMKALEIKAENRASRIFDLDEMVVVVSEKMMDLVEHQVDKLRRIIDGDEEDSESSVKDIINTIKEASMALKNCHYNVRLANDQATNILEERAVNKKLNDEERLRIAKEFQYLERSQKEIKGEIIAQLEEQKDEFGEHEESILEGDPSQTVVGLKPSPDTQQ